MPPEFGRYKILSEIGRGGMGIVYQAYDPDENRLVAIKRLVMENISPEKMREFRDRFKREAVTVKRLSHPNIVEVFDVEVEGDNYFYVMEFLEGHSLKSELETRREPMTPKEFWPYLSQVAEALDFAHTMNVVHRDVKPDNIFILKDGRVKITDFGIARAIDFEETKLTKTGVMLGTLAYVSPEQLQDAKNVDHRADIFSLGVVSYEALSKQIPFSGEGIAATIVKIVSKEEKPLHILNASIGVETSACVAKAMRKRARERYRSVKDFARDYCASLTDAHGSSSLRSVGQKTAENLQALPADYKPPSEPSSAMRIPPAANSASATGALSKSEETQGDVSPFQPLPQAINFPNSEAPESTSGTWRSVNAPSSGYNHNYDPKKQTDSFNAPRFVSTSLNQQTKGKFLKSITARGKEQSPFGEPAHLAFWSGRLVVADTSTRKLSVFSKDGRWSGDLAQLPDAKDSRTRGGSVTKPSGLAFDGRGRIYVTDANDHFIRVFDASGVFMRDFKNVHGNESGLTGIALDSTGVAYAADAINGCIQVFQSDMGTWIRKLGSKGDAPGQMQLPCGLAVDRLNQIYCVDYGLSRVSVFNKAGLLVRTFGEKGSAPGQFNVPRAVAVDQNDKIYVLDSLNHRVQVFSPAGEFLYIIGEKGSEPGQLLAPSDVSIDTESNTLYVADKGNKRVQCFQIEI
ncbi:MAG: protein kinase [Candidatus Melainabacteria bacterium]|jgi:serine/threonine-protein kinase|nr:protein kinase [Candidatus Melainabacteria bacterium]